MGVGAMPSAIGKYAPVGRLGSGGMADVFLVVARGPERVQRLAVLKRLKHPDQPDRIQMFLDEARLAVRLSHPNIVHTYEVAESGGDYFMTMEYLEGQALSEVLSALGDHDEGLSEALAASIAVQVLKGLHYAHEFCDFDGTPLGIVHRDVSPHNVFVTYMGDVKLLDFGIAKAHLNSTRTETGILKGKLRYMSPEQASQGDVDRRADVFSFGVILWEMLARRPLFQGDAIALLNQIAAHAIPKLTDLREEIAPELDAIVRKSLAQQCDDRYASADEMRQALQRLFRGAGDDDSRADLARLMNNLFASQRDTLRTQIRLHLANRPESDGSASKPSFETANLPTLVQSSPEPSAITSLPLVSMPAPKGSPWRARWLVAIGLVGLLALAIGERIWQMRTAARAAQPAPLVQTPTVVEAAPPPKKVLLHLETTPPGALAEWEGQRFGPTPVDVPLAAGTQKLAITYQGYEAELLTVESQPGEELRRSVTLRASAPLVTSTSSASTSGRPSKRDTPRASRPSVADAAPPPSATAAPSASARPELRIQMLDEGDGK